MKKYTEITLYKVWDVPLGPHEYHAFDHHCTDLHSLGFTEIILLCLMVYPLSPQKGNLKLNV